MRLQVDLGGSPCGVAVAEGAVWVSLNDTGELVRVDPETGEATGRVELSEKPCEITVTDDSLWVVTQSGVVDRVDPSGSTSILRLDPDTLESTRVEVGGDRPGYLAATGDTVWVSRVRSGSVVAVDAAARTAVGEPVPAEASPVNLHASPDGRWVWVPDDRTDFLTRIDAATGEAVEQLRVGVGPAVVAPTDDGVWVTNFGDGTVWYLATDDG